MSREELFTRDALPHFQAVQTYALQLCRNKQNSEDLAQETMYKAWKYMSSYEEGTNCRAWLLQICKNSFINTYRRKKLEPIAIDFQDEAYTSLLWNTTAEKSFSAGSDRNNTLNEHSNLISDEVALALSNLQPDYQTVILLCDVEGYTYEEIAEFMRVPIGTIRSRIHRGRKLLSQSLSEYARDRGIFS